MGSRRYHNINFFSTQIPNVVGSNPRLLARQAAFRLVYFFVYCTDYSYCAACIVIRNLFVSFFLCMFNIHTLKCSQGGATKKVQWWAVKMSKLGIQYLYVTLGITRWTHSYSAQQEAVAWKRFSIFHCLLIFIIWFTICLIVLCACSSGENLNYTKSWTSAEKNSGGISYGIVWYVLSIFHCLSFFITRFYRYLTAVCDSRLKWKTKLNHKFNTVCPNISKELKLSGWHRIVTVFPYYCKIFLMFNSSLRF